MKTHWKRLFLLYTLTAGFGLMPVGLAMAQTFSTLHSFTVGFGDLYTNSDGASPYAGLVLSGNTLYGTAHYGGKFGSGAIFAININGMGYTNLYSFSALDNVTQTTNGDGAYPQAVLLVAGGTLYGTTSEGGTTGNGTVFRVSTDGMDFTNLHSFTARVDFSTNSDGSFPFAGLVLSGNSLYGEVLDGGLSGSGAVFRLNTDGTGYTNLHSFTAEIGNVGFSGTNADGAHPAHGLILSGSRLYGTTYEGGSVGNGVVFALNTDGTSFTNLHNFAAGLAGDIQITNTDGAYPQSRLLLSGSTLYGTAGSGGSSGAGVVYALSTNGTGFTNLYSFSGLDAATQTTNNDGAYPVADVVISGNTLYGATQNGGVAGNGTLFALNTDGTGFTNLHTFTAMDQTYYTNSDGANSYAGLFLLGNTLYGTASSGGVTGNGTVFNLILAAPQLTIIPYGANVILTWTTNAVGYNLQSSTNLVSPVWSTNASPAVLIGDQSAVFAPVDVPQKFYRLSR